MRQLKAYCAICGLTTVRLLRFSLVGQRGFRGARGAGGLWLCQECWTKHARSIPTREVISLGMRAHHARRKAAAA